MGKAGARAKRVGDMLQKELANILQREASDARFSLVTIMDVTVAHDLSFAKIYVSVFNEEQAKEIVAALNKAASYFRVVLAKRIDLRVVPEIRFIFDDSAVKGERIDSLLNKLNKKK